MNDNNLIYATIYKGIEVLPKKSQNPQEQMIKNDRLMQIEVLPKNGQNLKGV